MTNTVSMEDVYDVIDLHDHDSTYKQVLEEDDAMKDNDVRFQEEMMGLTKSRASYHR